MEISSKFITYYRNVLISNSRKINNKEYLNVYNQFMKLKYPKRSNTWEIPHGRESYKNFIKYVDTMIQNGHEDKVIEILSKNQETFEDLIDFYKVNRSAEHQKITYEKMMSYYSHAINSMDNFIYYDKENRRKLIELELNELESFNNRKNLR